ncbi:ABC-ATPase domain-containing protein [uncultured Ilyobacter sp.]|uniref:ABC-ATPase domain-containing protein n=1 Tax=uncultured Ilyobacter sp. TaxID=544433 RepID=UPI0029F48169|nr:ABC-ATPase domain-containing protein [uncultured Ilyobacter sp.]
MKNLETILKRIDGKGYKSYKDIKGNYKFTDYTLNILRVQGDPYASPSLFSIEIDLKKYRYEKELYDREARKTAFEDYVLRKIGDSLRERNGKSSRNIKGADLSILSPGQEIMKRSAVDIKGDILTLRFYVNLPARGRTILGKEAQNLIFNEVIKMPRALKKENIKTELLKKHIEVNEKATMIREEIKKRDIIAFVAEGAVLARKSSVDDRPMSNAVKFTSPDTMKITLTLENKDQITGMGIKKGITTITGGGFHGKTTLLNAIEKGVYNHIPGDGREYVITSYDAVKIRAEDGRSIEKVNISNFIDNLPHKKDTKKFSTENSSGSTSQACNIIEALELGADTLLIDEDTSATNFMVRDRKIQELISHDKEPITPFIEKVVSMKKQRDISTIIVVGGLGDYFSVSDRVLMLDEYKVIDVTEKAKEIDMRYSESKISVSSDEFKLSQRVLDSKKTPLLFRDKKCKIRGRELDELSINRESVDIRSLEQLVEKGQVLFIGEVMKKIFTSSKRTSLKETLNEVEIHLKKDNICEYLRCDKGNLVFSRKYEVGAAINRLRKEIFL